MSNDIRNARYPQDYQQIGGLKRKADALDMNIRSAEEKREEAKLNQEELDNVKTTVKRMTEEQRKEREQIVPQQKVELKALGSMRRSKASTSQQDKGTAQTIAPTKTGTLKIPATSTAHTGSSKLPPVARTENLPSERPAKRPRLADNPTKASHTPPPERAAERSTGYTR